MRSAIQHHFLPKPAIVVETEMAGMIADDESAEAFVANENVGTQAENEVGH